MVNEANLDLCHIYSKCHYIIFGKQGSSDKYDWCDLAIAYNTFGNDI